MTSLVSLSSSSSSLTTTPPPRTSLPRSLLQRFHTSAFPFTVCLMVLSIHFYTVLPGWWIHRVNNMLADALTNEFFGEFDMKKRIHITTDILKAHFTTAIIYAVRSCQDVCGGASPVYGRPQDGGRSRGHRRLVLCGRRDARWYSPEFGPELFTRVRNQSLIATCLSSSSSSTTPPPRTSLLPTCRLTRSSTCSSRSST